MRKRLHTKTEQLAYEEIAKGLKRGRRHKPTQNLSSPAYKFLFFFGTNL